MGVYYGTQYRVRLFPPFGYSMLYKEHNLTRFNHQNSTTQVQTAYSNHGNRFGDLYTYVGSYNVRRIWCLGFGVV